MRHQAQTETDLILWRRLEHFKRGCKHTLGQRCKVCADLIVLTRSTCGPQPKKEEPATFTQIQDSAKSGCAGCQILTLVLRPYWDLYQLTDEVKWRLGGGYGPLSIRLFEIIPNSGPPLQERHISTVDIWSLTGMMETVQTQGMAHND